MTTSTMSGSNMFPENKDNPWKGDSVKIKSVESEEAKVKNLKTK